MHREISHADQKFQPESRLFLYVFTALIGLLLARRSAFPDRSLAFFADWTSDNGVPLPKDNLLFGFQLALYAAVLGGAARPLRLARFAAAGPHRRRPGPGHRLHRRHSLRGNARRRRGRVHRHGRRMSGKLHLRAHPAGRCADRRDLPAPLLAAARRAGRARAGRELQVGDRVVVKPGARMPADGVVLEADPPSMSAP